MEDVKGLQVCTGRMAAESFEDLQRGNEQAEGNDENRGTDKRFCSLN